MAWTQRTLTINPANSSVHSQCYWACQDSQPQMNVRTQFLIYKQYIITQPKLHCLYRHFHLSAEVFIRTDFQFSSFRRQ